MVLLESRTKTFSHKSIDTSCFTAITKSVTQNIRGVTENTAYRKESFPRKESDTMLFHSMYFAYEVGIISSYSDRICYRNIAKSRTKDDWELQRGS